MSRYTLNEVPCPVPLDLLALLLRSDEAKVAETVLRLSVAHRAALAVYCFGRCHMRTLGIAIGRHCSERSLWVAGGSMGQVLYEQAGSDAAFDVGPAQYQKRKVTLAKVAA